MRDSLRHQTRIGAALASISLAAAALTGCSATLGLGDYLQCEMNVQNPHQSKGSPQYMDSKMSFLCNGPVNQVNLAIKMEKYVGSQWVLVPTSPATRFVGSNPSRTVIKIQTGGNLPCVNGTYRTVGKGSATNSDGLSDSTDWYAADPVEVTCE